MGLFRHTINGWSSWGNVFQSIEAFAPIIRLIYEKENLQLEHLEHLTPGTNAVFKVGNTVCKIFAPKQSGLDSQSDYDTELFGLKRASLLGVSAPKLIASGKIHDRYEFLYFIMEYIDGKSLGDTEGDLTDLEKEEIGRKLRKITDKLNTPCKRFNHWNVVNRELCNKRWNKLQDSLNEERLAYLRNLQIHQMVYVHGDLNRDNVLLDKDSNLYIIDFADALLAPAEYELVALCGLFDYSSAYMRGYFGKGYNAGEIAKKYYNGILLHDFGADIILERFGASDELMGLDILKQRIFDVFEQGKGFGRGRDTPLP